MTPRATLARGSADLVSILEAAYATSPTTEQWLGAVLDAFSASFLNGGGCYGYTFRRSDERVEGDTIALAGLPSRFRRYVQSMLTVADPRFLSTMYDCPPCATLSSLGSAKSGPARFPTPRASSLNRAMSAEALGDQLGLRAEDGSPHGVLIGAPLPVRTKLQRREIATLMRVLAHVAAGYRLHRSELGTDPDGVGYAVLRPSGRIEHAEGAATGAQARKALTRGAERRALARERLRRDDPIAAVEAWRALVDGRWSLVDHFDHDGRRYLIARPNAPRHPPPATLTPRQSQVVSLVALGHSNKLVAYELGISLSAVSSYLSAAARKLGASSRVELVRAYKVGLAHEAT